MYFKEIPLKGWARQTIPNYSVDCPIARIVEEIENALQDEGVDLKIVHSMDENTSEIDAD